MTELLLERRWLLGDEVGSGGFGHVYEAEADDGFTAVAKLIPKAPGADRELLFEDLEGVRNVVPILESGDADDYWALIMPRADRSLRDHMIEQACPIEADAVVSVIQDLVAAMSAGCRRSRNHPSARQSGGVNRSRTVVMTVPPFTVLVVVVRSMSTPPCAPASIRANDSSVRLAPARVVAAKNARNGIKE